MTDAARFARQARLSLRIQRLTAQVEKLVPQIKRAQAGDTSYGPPLAPAARSLERAAGAVRALAEERRPAGELPALLLEETSSLMSLLGSRVVLSRAGHGAPPPPSAGAQALALLLEDPSRTFQAAEVAERIGCSAAVARTTLNRLVQSGHASRAAAGKFGARRRRNP
jgi:hypothetical protein